MLDYVIYVMYTYPKTVNLGLYLLFAALVVLMLTPTLPQLMALIGSVMLIDVHSNITINRFYQTKR